jgi:actin-related protein
MENLYTLIFDIGQFSCKIGYGGENEPRHTFYTITGQPKYQGIGLEQEQKKPIYIGNEIVDHIGLYKISHPVANGGEIVQWEEFKAIIDYIFYLLRVNPSMCKILFTTNPFLSRESKKRLFEFFLEEYTIGGYYPVRGALLTMYSGGFDTGLVVDMGAANIRITPIYKSFVISHAVKFLNLGGNVLDKFMSTKLEEIGMATKSSSEQNLVRLLKERACFTSLDFDTDMKNKDKFLKEYALPDSTTIEIGQERFLIPELLFNPTLNSIESESIVEGIVNAIESCDIDIRRELLYNIFLTGGTSMIPLFEVRLKHEIEEELVRRERVGQNIRIIASKGRVYSNWVGGSILSMIPEFQQNWIDRKKYFEDGLTEELLDA